MDDRLRDEIYRRLDALAPEVVFFLKPQPPFRYLVTVILSASSTDRQAELSAEKLFSVYKDEREMAEGSEEEIEALIHSSGLSRSKARNILALSRIVAKEGIPTDRKGLEALPGVGEKTASCYITHILGGNAVVADTHFVRVARRLGLTTTEDRNKAAKEIRETIPEERWNRISDTVNWFGRHFCSPRATCEACPLGDICPSKKE